MDPLVGSALISAGSGLIGNIFGKSSQDSANRTNIQLAKMNNQFNERMLEKEMAYNTEMWNKQNAYNEAYNNPTAQRERLEKAGLNPYLMMNGGSAGNVTAASALGVKTPQAQAATVSPYNPNMSGFEQAAQMLYNRQIMQADVQSRQLDNSMKQVDLRTRYTEALLRLQNMRKDLEGKGQNLWINREQHELRKMLGYAQYDVETQRLNNMKLEAEGMSLNQIQQRLINENLPTSLKMDIAYKASQIALNRNLSNTEGYKQWQIMQNVVESSARELGYHLDNYQKQKTVRAIIDIAESDAFWNGWKNFGQGLSDVGSGIGNFIGSLKKAIIPTKNK